MLDVLGQRNVSFEVVAEVEPALFPRGERACSPTLAPIEVQVGKARELR